MGRLPTELVDRIMLGLDEKTLDVLYDRGVLMDMVSAPAAREIEEKVLRRAREEHKRLLFSVHRDFYFYYVFFSRFWWTEDSYIVLNESRAMRLTAAAAAKAGKGGRAYKCICPWSACRRSGDVTT